MKHKKTRGKGAAFYLNKAAMMLFALALVVGCLPMMAASAFAESLEGAQTAPAAATGDAISPQGTGPFILFNGATDGTGSGTGATYAYTNGSAAVDGGVGIRTSDKQYETNLGDTITLVITPQSGWVPNSVDAGGQMVTLTKNGDTYNGSFIVNANTSRVDITFKEDLGFTLTLPAEYTTSYQNDYGTVEWATSPDATTWNPITTGTRHVKVDMPTPGGGTVEFHNYTFESKQTVYIKATFPEANPSGWTGMEGNGWPTPPFENGTLANGEVKELLGSGTLQYDDWYTIWWQYTDPSKDNYVSGGKIIITSLEGGAKPEKNNVADSGEGDEGMAFMSYNTKVTIKFVPNPGYQFDALRINGQPVPLTPEQATSTFTFNVKAQLHFSGEFIANPDIVKNTATGITSASLDNAANAAPSGNTVLSVTDSNVSAATRQQMQAAAGTGATVQSVIDLTIDQAVSKGGALTSSDLTSDKAWISPKTELDAPVTVNIVLADGTVPAGQAVSVVRDHNGVLTAIDTTYNAATNTASFASDQFSSYAITTKPATIAKTGDTGGMPLTLGLLAAGCVALAASFVLRRREQS